MVSDIDLNVACRVCNIMDLRLDDNFYLTFKWRCEWCNGYGYKKKGELVSQV